MLFQQEVLHILERYALTEPLPRWQTVLVFLIADGALQSMVVLPGQSKHLADDLRLSLAVLPRSGLIQDRKKEYDFVALIEKVECVVLNVLQLVVVLAQSIAYLVVVLKFSPVDIFGGLLNLPVEHVAFEVVLLVITHQIYCVVYDFLLLAELTWMDYHKVLAKIQFADVLAQTSIHRKCQRQLLLHLLLQVAGHLVLEQLLPTQTVFGVRLQHFLNQLLAHIRNIIDCAGEVKVFLVDHHLKLIDIFGVVGRSSQGHKYLPKSIQQQHTPSEYISALLLYSWLSKTSGAMLRGDPSIVSASTSGPSILLNPKSAILVTPSWRRILASLRSRCKILWEKRWRKALIHSQRISIDSSSVRKRLFLTQTSRSPSLQYSRTRQQLLEVFFISQSFMML